VLVYGTKLDKITGRVKLSVVGYGRKTQEWDDTLGGRNATELSANITKLNHASVPVLEVSFLPSGPMAT
jgi:hypothetical protein